MSKLDLKKHLQSIPPDVLLGDILPFLPTDNVQDSSAGPSLQQTESAASLQNHLSSLTLLLKMGFLPFLKNLQENKPLHTFLESYLSYRTKPYLSNDGDAPHGSVSLFKLDRLVFMVFLRLFSITNEHLKIPNLLPKAKISVLNTTNGETGKANESVSPTELEEQFRFVLDSMKFAKFPYLLELFVIAGESNRTLSLQLFQRLVQWKAATLQTEIVKVIEETHRSCQELLQSTWQAHSRYFSLEKVSMVPKKGSRVINKSALLNKASTFDVMKELHYLAAFAADIIHSLAVFLSLAKSTPTPSSTSSWLAGSAFFTSDGKQLTSAPGLKLVEILLMVYETAVPTLQDVMKKARKSSSTTVTEEELALVDKMEDFVHIMQSWSLQALHHLVLVSDEALKQSNSTTSSSTKASSSAKYEKASSTTTAVTWLEVLSHRIDLKTILVGVYLDESQLRPGSLTSDYLQAYDRTEVYRVIKAFMTPDDMDNLEYYLTSLCLEDSALKAKVDSTGDSKAPAASFPPSTGSSKSAVPSSSAKADANAQAEKLQESIEAVKGIFPDLGEGFVEACVTFYHGNAEEVIDALLSNNLHPQLSVLDRSMKKMWVGKQSLVQENSKLLYAGNQNSSSAKGSATNNAHDEKINYQAYLDESHNSNKNFKKVQKDLLKTIEKQQEYDAYIVDKEYDDDYDDQYDDTLNKKPLTAQDAEAFWNSEKPNKPVVTDWKQQMAETRRYNSLLREEEKEVAFWENMRNTNRTAKVNSGRDSWKRELDQEDVDEEEQDAESNTANNKGAGKQHPGHPAGPSHKATQPNNTHKDQPAKAQPQKQGAGGGGGGGQQGKPQHNNNNNNNNNNKKTEGGDHGKQPNQKKADNDGESKGSGGGGDHKKFRTKNHDKYHQKDKALRKFGSFA